MAALSFALAKIIVGDLDAVEKFYTSTLGLTRAAYIEFGEGPGQLQEVILAVPGGGPTDVKLHLVRYPNNPAPVPGEAIVGFMVDDVEATAAAMIAAGGRIVAPVQEIPEHRLKLAFVADVEGHTVEILQAL
ncbi:MAG TPA: VOC family protein [Pedomonas sp.]|uniref:VOC family protein n=1 Tax=Pedomonas sp. TaxID=2976421 RepID=UPI002F41D445